MTTTTTNAVAVAAPPRASILARVAERYSVEPNRLLDTLKATAFKGSVSNEQMMALLIVADQYKLNPFTRELFAFPDQNNGVVPVVSVDGWARIINEHPQFDGLEFEFDATGEACTCRIYRKDREHPTVVTEYMSECRRGTQPWKSHPRRMLRHKTLIQCARLAFGYAGIYDQDEAERIVEATAHDAPSVIPPRSAGGVARLRGAVLPQQPQPTTLVPDEVSTAPGGPDAASLFPEGVDDDGVIGNGGEAR